MCQLGIYQEQVQKYFECFIIELPNNLPSAEEGAHQLGLAKNFLHTKGKVAKQVIATKLKAVRWKYRQAVDSGKCSGHGYG